MSETGTFTWESFKEMQVADIMRGVRHLTEAMMDDHTTLAKELIKVSDPSEAEQ